MSVITVKFEPSSHTFQGHSRSSQVIRFSQVSLTSSNRWSLLTTMGISHTVSEISGDLCWQRKFSYILAFNAYLEGSTSGFCDAGWVQIKLQWRPYNVVEKRLMICITCLDINLIPQR